MITIIEHETGREIPSIGMWKETFETFSMVSNQGHSLFEMIDGIEFLESVYVPDYSICYTSCSCDPCPQHPMATMFFEEGRYVCSECYDLSEVKYDIYQLPEGFTIK
jgi:hypothetical protein